MMITPYAISEDRKDDNQEEDDTIITPRDPTTLFNFGPASSRDNIVFTCERPGGDLVHADSDPTSTSTTSTIIPSQAVKEWAQFMKNEDNRINEVLVLLDDNELECYEEPGLVALYEQYGFTVHRVPMGDPDAPARVLALLSSCQEDDDDIDNIGRNDTKTTHQRKIVVHCTHGQGRAGRVAAAWLTHQYGLSPEDATTEVLNTALQMGITRMGSPSKLRAWLRKEQLKKEEHSSV
jgi:protein-tyrosine phosphatase